jgi:hypothetical protein
MIIKEKARLKRAVMPKRKKFRKLRETDDLRKVLGLEVGLFASWILCKEQGAPPF